MCLCVLSAGINQSVCEAEPLPTMEPFSGPGAFYQYTHSQKPRREGGWGHVCVYLERDEDVYMLVCVASKKFCIRI